MEAEPHINAKDEAVEHGARRLVLSIIIVSFNTREMILGCLRSIRSEILGIDFEVIVVDNASQDGSPGAIASEFPEARLMELKDNLGFARANNLAAAGARGEYLLLLNPDTVVLEGSVQALLDFARSHPEAGIVGGRTLYDDRSLNITSCFNLPSLWSLFCQGTGLSSAFRSCRLLNPELIGSWPRDTVRRVGVITGCFLLLRRDFWDQLGGFDEVFFMYSEDTDLSYRAAQAGKICLHCPSAEIIHHGGGSEGIKSDKTVRVNRGKAQFMRKHWSPIAFRFGVLMLDLQAWSRMIAHAPRAVFGGESESFKAWREVWRRRDRWRSPNPRSSRGGMGA